MNLPLLNKKSSNEVIPGLFIGNACTAQFALNRYDLIVNCTRNIPDALPLPESMKGNIVLGKLGQVIRIPIDDDSDDSDILLSHLPNVTEKIHATLNNKGKVLVHCSMGVSRSCTVVAAYLLRYYNESVDNVINFIKSTRSEAFFQEVRFQSVLTFFEKKYR